MRVRISYTRHAFKLPRTLSGGHECSRSQCTLSREDATVPILDPANAQSRAVDLPIVAIQVFWTSCAEVGNVRGRGRDGRAGWREKDAVTKLRRTDVVARFRIWKPTEKPLRRVNCALTS